MNDIQKLIDLFFRFRFTLESGLDPRFGYNFEAALPPDGSPSTVDIFKGKQMEILSEAVNGYLSFSFGDNVQIKIQCDLNRNWEVWVSNVGHSRMTPEEAMTHADFMTKAARTAIACQKVLKRQSFDFDVSGTMLTLNRLMKEARFAAYGEPRRGQKLNKQRKYLEEIMKRVCSHSLTEKVPVS